MTDIPASLSELDEDDKGRLIVKASHRNPVDIADEVAAYILANNDPPRLFSMSPAAVTLKNGALHPARHGRLAVVRRPPGHLHRAQPRTARRWWRPRPRS